MNYRTILSRFAECVRHRVLPLHADVDSATTALPDDLCSTPVAGTFRRDGWYTLLMAVTRKGTRIALDNEVVPFVTEKGESTFTLTDEAIKIGDLKFEWQRGR